MEARDDPHRTAAVYCRGTEPQNSTATLIMLHGRGSNAASMLSLFEQMRLSNIAVIAPEATNNSWYPYSFLTPRQRNEPFLSSALELIHSKVLQLEQLGIPSSKIVVMGFSQGACLACEYVARYPQKYGGLIAFTGALIGPLDRVETYEGNLFKTPVFIGTSDPDPHVPLEKVKQSAKIFEELGAEVDLRTYKDMPHTINDEELEIAKKLVSKI